MYAKAVSQENSGNVFPYNTKTGTIRTLEWTKKWSVYSHSANLDIGQTEPQAPKK